MIETAVISPGENVLLKPVFDPELSEFKKLMKQAQAIAIEAGLTEDDIADAIKAVRLKNNVCE